MVALLLLGCAGEATEKPAGRERDSGPATDADSGQDSADTGEPADTGDTGPVVDTADTGDTAEVVDDADGDGFRAQDGDCDDARANVYPGAPDGCDALDQDCDGEAIPAGACGEEWDPAVSASWVLVGDAEGALYSAPLAPGDLDGDGLGDVVYEQFPEKSYSIGFLSGGSLDWSGLVGETRGQVRAVYLRDQLSRTVAARDVDGDGLDDVWSWGSSSTAYDGNVYLLAGGSSAFDGGTHDVREVALGWWTDARDDGDVIALIAGGAATVLTLWSARAMGALLPRINYRMVSACVLLFVTALVVWRSGPLGLLVLLVATATGLVAVLTKAPRHHLMACILIPVIWATI